MNGKIYSFDDKNSKMKIYMQKTKKCIIKSVSIILMQCIFSSLKNLIYYFSGEWRIFSLEMNKGKKNKCWKKSKLFFEKSLLIQK